VFYLQLCVEPMPEYYILLLLCQLMDNQSAAFAWTVIVAGYHTCVWLDACLCTQVFDGGMWFAASLVVSPLACHQH